MDLVIASIIGAGLVGAPLFALWRSAAQYGNTYKQYLVQVDDRLRRITVSPTGGVTGYGLKQLSEAQGLLTSALRTTPGRTSVNPPAPGLDGAM